MPKTVYILGAGFSKPAGFPLQGELYSSLLEKVFAPFFAEDKYFNLDEGNTLRAFLGDSGLVQRKSGTPNFAISLEDLFTLLDQIITSRSHYCGYTWVQIIGIREYLIRSILGILHHCSDSYVSAGEKLIPKFAAWLIGERVKATLEADPISVISLNWDSLLEDSIYWVLKRSGFIPEGKHIADVDYCVYHCCPK